VWFGIIGALGLLLGIIVMGSVASRFAYTGPESSLRSLKLLVWLQFAGLLTFALVGNFYVAVGAMFVMNLARGIGGSLFSAWLNREIESPHRATVLSIVNQSDAVGQWAGGPVIGAVGTVLSLRWALPLGAAVLIPASGLLDKVRKRVRSPGALARREKTSPGPRSP
jgi:hypothetical protein